MKEDLITLWKITTKRRHIQFFLILILMIISSIFEVVSIGLVLPFLGVLTSPETVFNRQELQPVIDLFQFSNPTELILPMTVIFIISAFITGIIRVLLLYTTTRFSYATGADLALDVYRRTLYQEYSEHLAQNSSEIINSITVKTHTIIAGMLNPSLIFISSLILIVITSSTLFYIDPTVTLISFFFFGLFYLSIIIYTHRKLRESSESIAKESSKIIKAVQEGLGGIRDVIIDGNQEFYSKIYRKSDIPLRKALGYIQFINGSPRYVMESIGMVLIAGIAYFMSLQEAGLSAVIPVLGALALGAQRILPALQQLYGAYTSIKSAKSSFIDVLNLLEQPLSRDNSLLTSSPIIFKKNIHINNISFKYSGTKKEVLKNISLNIPKGSITGFIGTTGSGKSTLLDIVMGLLTQTSGEIKIDNIKIDNSNQQLWRNNIAHVPQNVFLSDASIRENIAFGVPINEIIQDRVENAAKQSQLDELIDGLPEKYETHVGERGVRLSGGQRQRIGIARAIYKQAQVLIFDEATSALDTKTETDVMKSIYNLNKNLTILIIAHRVATLKNCDVIYDIRKGTIVNSGTFSQILEEE
jgi:ABC-type multidrug transport system fused ATPase/permease subunit